MSGVQVEALDSRAAESAVREMEREMHAAHGAAMRRAREAAAAVRISGATGDCAGDVDGLFELTDEAGNGPVWKKCGAEVYLYRAHSGSWYVSGAASKDAARALVPRSQPPYWNYITPPWGGKNCKAKPRSFPEKGPSLV